MTTYQTSHGERLLSKLSTKCLPDETLDTSSRAKEFLTKRGVDLGGEQQTKTKTALEFFSKELQTADP